jgi:hypothetical protein
MSSVTRQASFRMVKANELGIVHTYNRSPADVDG